MNRIKKFLGLDDEDTKYRAIQVYLERIGIGLWMGLIAGFIIAACLKILNS